MVRKPKKSYIAGKRVKRKGGGYYESGQPVPEASNWKHPESWVSSGHLIEVVDLPSSNEQPEPSRRGVEARSEPEPTRETDGFPCPHCDKVCASEHGLKLHMARMHE